MNTYRGNGYVCDNRKAVEGGVFYAVRSEDQRDKSVAKKKMTLVLSPKRLCAKTN
jgi:hypothetical protein